MQICQVLEHHDKMASLGPIYIILLNITGVPDIF